MAAAWNVFSRLNASRSIRAVISCAPLIVLLLGVPRARPAAGNDSQDKKPERTKIAEGEYVLHELNNNGAAGPFGEEIYDFHEDWTLSSGENGRYQVEGTRRFDSPRDEPHSNRFRVDLSRDFTVIRATEFAALRWVTDSGPLSCEFLPAALSCSAGGSDPKREIKLRTRLDKPFGLLWPVSPFSFSGIARQIERDPGRPAPVDLIRIEQPSKANPVQATVLEGPLLYLGEEDIEAAGRKWRAHKFSLKVPLNPEYLIWTSPSKGLLLALAVQHEHLNWREEGMRLERFESSTEF